VNVCEYCEQPIREGERVDAFGNHLAPHTLCIRRLRERVAELEARERGYTFDERPPGLGAIVLVYCPRYGRWESMLWRGDDLDWGSVRRGMITRWREMLPAPEERPDAA
jgi:hypothetical protein